MDLIARYRQSAEECRTLAKAAKSYAVRFRYELLAKNWDRLAAEREQFLRESGDKGTNPPP